MDMPCLQHLLSELAPLDIREDLWSRGWSEITTGMHGTKTGAFYDKPVLDGGPGFTQKYSVNDYEKVPGCKPIWSALAKKGQKMGFLNLPTSIPAPDVPGFFISGPGAGFSPASRIPTQACSPKTLYKELFEENMIWEQRYQVSGIQSIDFFIERCCKAVQDRARLYAKLCISKAVDTGLIVQKEMVMITNLFMFEIEPMLNSGGQPSTPLQRRIAEFFRILDDSIRYVVNLLDPQSIIVVSDHSVRSYKHSLNLTQFLISLNLQKSD
jgi:predicted AlkP superfamily phosphohydrolase/phosphomutase